MLLSETFYIGASVAAVLDVHYVAEHHENLNHVLVFLTVPEITPGADIKAEVIPSLVNITEGDRLVISCGLATSPELDLPVRIAPGMKDVRVQSSHFELKLATSSRRCANFPSV
jgi:hypothetical protein